MSPRNPTIIGFGATVIGVDSTVKVGNRVVVSGLIAGDTIVNTYYSNDTLKATRRKVGTSDSTYLPAPAYSKSNTYKGCIQIILVGGSKFPSAPMCWTWVYTRNRPMLTVDSVARITLRFEKPIVGPDETSQVCAFGEMLDGHKVKLANTWNNSLCETMYQSWLAEQGV